MMHPFLLYFNVNFFNEHRYKYRAITPLYSTTQKTSREFIKIKGVYFIIHAL